MSQIDSGLIKKGLWTDQERGHVLGLTITTDTNTSTFLIALLAVLTTLGTAHLWHLVTFFIHQARADGRPTDALFRQQQVLLRTTPPPSAVVADLIKVWWSWRGKARRPLLRSIALIIIAVVFTLTTVVGGVFSSLVISTSDIVVLVNSPYCGWSTKDENTLQYQRAVLTTSGKYAENCYFKPLNESKSRLCEIFPSPTVSLNSQLTSCPFGPICGHEEAVSVDSGLLDVNEAFGMNLARNDQVRYRKKTTCQILPLEGYTRIPEGAELDAIEKMLIPPPFPEGHRERMSMEYGAAPAQAPPGYNTSVLVDVTRANQTWGMQIYNLVHHTSLNKTSQRKRIPLDWEPLPELRRDDGDTSLMTATFCVTAYRRPIDDPFFAAHRQEDVGVYMKEKPDFIKLYFPDYPVRALGCLQQYQFCHAHASKPEFCAPLAGVPEVSSTAFPDANELQLTVLKLLSESSYLFDRAIWERTQVRDYYDYIVPSLPDDQWVHEAVRAEQVAWSALQAGVADYAIGPAIHDDNTDRWKTRDGWIHPVTKGEHQLCGMQRMRKNGDVANISVFGLTFVVTFSCLVAIIDITLLKILIYVSKFQATLTPRLNRWIQDGVWQLQRHAYEAQGHDNWFDIEREVPLNKEGSIFKDLPASPLSPRHMRVDLECFGEVPSRSSVDARSREEEFRPPTRSDTDATLIVEPGPSSRTSDHSTTLAKPVAPSECAGTDAEQGQGRLEDFTRCDERV